jgi:hypothetical protein
VEVVVVVVAAAAAVIIIIIITSSSSHSGLFNDTVSNPEYPVSNDRMIVTMNCKMM